MKISSGRALAIFFILSAVFIQARESELRPYRLINADELMILRVDQEYVTELEGNVHFFYGETEFRSNKAFIYETQKIAELMGNVSVDEDTLKLYADQVRYKRLEEHIYLEGNVVINQFAEGEKKRTFTSHSADYNQITSELYAYDNIFYHDSTENVNARCHYLFYNVESETGHLLSNPVISFTGEDTLTVTAERIDFNNELKRAVATFNVNTETNEFTATSNFLLFFWEEERAVYQGNPIFSSDFADGSSETIQIFFNERKIDKVVLTDNSELQFTTLNEADQESSAQEITKDNWVKSDFMEFFFEDGSIVKCLAESNVSSHFQQDDVSKDFFINTAVSDRMIINLKEDNQIETILLKSSAKGVYRFENKKFDNMQNQ